MTSSSPPSSISGLALVRLLQLSSPALPIGAYSYSQGLEAAIEAGTVVDAASAQRWIEHALRFGTAALEAPLWRRLLAAWRAEDLAAARAANAWFLATRETAELRAETSQMGYSLARLLGELEGAAACAPLQALGACSASISASISTSISLPAAFTFATWRWQIDEEAALLGYLWSALENQVMAAIKAIPLGQTDGQRILRVLGAVLPELAHQSAALAAGPDDELCNFTPGLALASSRHEAQYSRLFRS
jgi:urease accessory protein